MYPQPLSSPTTSSFPGSSLSISKPAIIKAFVLLVFFWLLATFAHFSQNGDDNVTTHAEAAQNLQEWMEVISPGENGARPSSTKLGSDSHQESHASVASPQQTTTSQFTQHTDRAAVIIENRPLENLIPVMLHFHSVLGPEWPIIFYTTKETADTLKTSAPFSRAVNEGRIAIRLLPETVSFSSHRAVSLFLAGSWLWEDLAPYQKILMFQDDSIICSASSAKMDDFIQYDLIGAPIAKQYGMGYNGGLSIRNRELVLDLFKMYSYANDSEVPDAPANMKFEDQWLYTRMLELPVKADGTPGANLPADEIARKFAVETVWEEQPLGFHQPIRWQKANMAKIVKYCPEVGMIGGAAFF